VCPAWTRPRRCSTSRAPAPPALTCGPVESLPYPDRAFDVVTAFNRSGTPPARPRPWPSWPGSAGSAGRSPSECGGDEARCQTEALFARLRSLAPPPGTPAPLAVSDPGVVEGLLDKADLTAAGGGEATVSLSYVGHDQAWTSAGSLQKVIDAAGPDAVRQVLHDVLEADRKPDGQLRQDNVFRYVLAARQ
jgi:hypothetical protein